MLDENDSKHSDCGEFDIERYGSRRGEFERVTSGLNENESTAAIAIAAMTTSMRRIFESRSSWSRAGREGFLKG